MTTYFNRTASEQEAIRKAYDFEIEAIESCSCEPNPYMDAIDAMGLRDALNEAVAMAYHQTEEG